MREYHPSDAGLWAFEQSFLEYPAAWYEHPIFRSRLLVLAIALPPFWLLAGLKILPNPPFSILSIAVYWLGLALDAFSTAQGSHLKPEFDKRGLTYPLVESAATLPSNPTLKDILHHWHFWVMILATPLICVVPTGAFGILVARLSATLSNLRNVKRVALALRRVDHPLPTQTPLECQ